MNVDLMSQAMNLLPQGDPAGAASLRLRASVELSTGPSIRGCHNRYVYASAFSRDRVLLGWTDVPNSVL